MSSPEKPSANRRKPRTKTAQAAGSGPSDRPAAPTPRSKKGRAGRAVARPPAQDRASLTGIPELQAEFASLYVQAAAIGISAWARILAPVIEQWAPPRRPRR
ncbi:hypothetical protein [Enterovirga aerilata]|uniref:Uncharacterized protein n=1 Tax=Enterovirga aerilata TaxID=2730920 RepID=A0A849IBJ0_9HYPH|nr:hypothetical protein [Enterovirga sp. DB1703]NNM73410.1 hypothetical protein [Enterovirga sp. DB1703]